MHPSGITQWPTRRARGSRFLGSSFHTRKFSKNRANSARSACSASPKGYLAAPRSIAVGDGSHHSEGSFVRPPSWLACSDDHEYRSYRTARRERSPASRENGRKHPPQHGISLGRRRLSRFHVFPQSAFAFGTGEPVLADGLRAAPAFRTARARQARRRL